MATTLRILRFVLLFSAVSGWVFLPNTKTRSICKSRCALNSEVRSISLEALDSDHEAEGARLQQSITAWLDAEWMPQQVHVKMAESAKKSYIACRQQGDVDIMTIMMAVANDLDEKWMELYDADAFVNAWDVSNYVSDYLTQRTGAEACECSTKIY